MVLMRKAPVCSQRSPRLPLLPPPYLAVWGCCTRPRDLKNARQVILTGVSKDSVGF